MASRLRKEGREKLTGRSQYVDDLRLPGHPEVLHGTTVRSPVARGTLKAVRFGGSIPWKDFVIVTAKDIPAIGGKNAIAHILHDQPCLVDEQINHPEEAIVLLAHPDRFLLEEARRHVTFEIDPLPAVFTIEKSLLKDPVIWGKDNTFKEFTIEKGDVDGVWQTADLIVEGEYHTGAQEQLYIEPNGMIAVANANEGVTVWGSMQCPYYVHHALTHLFALPDDKVRVIQAETGGGFGGKEDYPSMIACHAALLAWKAGKPVKIIYDRAEDLAATTKRHPSSTRHRTAVSRDGKLLAMDIDFLLDGGAYMTISTVVLSRGGIHAAGPYECPNVRIHARALATNSPPYGAFRGFGAPQSLFALERHMDEIAAKVGLAPEELRRRNFLQEGKATATGQIIREKLDLPKLLDSALQSSEFIKKRKAFQEANQDPANPIKRGMGLSTFMHGAGFTGSGEKMLASVAAVEATPAGTVRVLASNTEIGQGQRTVFAQLVADALGIDFDLVEVVQPDTKIVPNSGPTVASRTTMIVGKLVETAAISLRQTLIQSGCLAKTYTTAEFRKACGEYLSKLGALKCFSQYQQPGHIDWDDQKYRGDAYGTFAWAVYVAEVSVDLRTYEAQVDHFTAVQEIGKVVHPVLAAGQIEGGVLQGIGYALSEEVQLRNGRMANNRLTNYIIPTAADAPDIKVIFAENPYPHGPQGAKGIGELPLDGVAPAVLNAVAMALGPEAASRIHSIPLLPESLMKALDGAAESVKGERS